MISRQPVLALLLLVAVVFPSCVSTSNRPVPLQESQARSDLGDAMEYVEKGAYRHAIPRLQAIISDHPGTETALEARYWLAISYQAVGGTRDAVEIAQDYISLAPEGPYTDELRAWGKALESEYSGRFPSLDVLDRDIENLQVAVKKQPNSLPLHLQLADRLWQRGRYQEAGSIYTAAANKWPREVGKDQLYKRRIDVHRDGSTTILSPAEINQQDIARNPVAIINTSSFGAGRSRISRTRTNYVVTGQVLNRSEDVVYGVDVLVTIYGFGGPVYDTTTYRIDRLFPEETRAFSVSFRNFPDINQIERYEATVSFQR